jgi:hypothetical protein
VPFSSSPSAVLPVANYTLSYTSDPSKTITNLTINNNASIFPTTLTFNFTTSATYSTIFLSSFGVNNRTPYFVSTAGSSITINFSSPSLYNDYITNTDAEFFVLIRWN